MPGLIGIISDNGNVESDVSLLEKMIESIKHEKKYKVDKYNSTFFSGARVHLGTFNPETQPIFNEDKSICIFMDGKIYGYEEEKHLLRQKGHKFVVNNDVDFCLHLYEKEGENFIRQINGSFIILIYDLNRNKLLIFTDRYGFKPHYFVQVNGKFLVAPECKSILQEPELKKNIDHSAVADLFAFGEVLGDKTFFKDIEVLPSGCILNHSDGRLSVKRYWDFNYRPEYNKLENTFVDELVCTFKKSVEIRLKDDYRYGISLSGGLDSRTIIGAIPRDKKNDVISFTFGPSKCNEVKIAKKVAAISGIQFNNLLITPKTVIENAERVVNLTEGMNYIGVSFIPPMHKEISNKVDVIIDGFALDLTLGGGYLDSFKNITNEKELLDTIYQRRLFSDEEFKKLFQEKYYDRVKNSPFISIKENLEKVEEENLQNKIDHFFMDNHVRRLTMEGYVLMRSEVEHLVPTADNNLMDLIMTIPPHLRRKHYIYRKFLKQLSPCLAAICYSNTGIRADFPLLLWKIGLMQQYYTETIKKKIRSISRNKIFIAPQKSYVNFDEWFCRDKEWQDFFIRLLLGKDVVSTQTYLNRDYIECLFKEQFSGQKDNSMKILYVATFELFLKLFMENRQI